MGVSLDVTNNTLTCGYDMKWILGLDPEARSGIQMDTCIDGNPLSDRHVRSCPQVRIYYNYVPINHYSQTSCHVIKPHFGRFANATKRMRTDPFVPFGQREIGLFKRHPYTGHSILP